MSFNKKIIEESYEPYRKHYIKYKELKRMTKSNLTQREEDEFEEKLSNEFKSVFGFVELHEKEIRELITSWETGAPLPENIEETRDKLFELSEFVRTNITGFKKIIATHDKKSGHRLGSNYRKILDNCFLKLEDIHGLCQRMDRILPAKNVLSPSEKHCIESPLLPKFQTAVLGSAGLNCWPKEETIISVYLDNVRLEYYSNVLQKKNSETIRIYWHVSNPSIVTVEMRRGMGINPDKTKFLIPSSSVLGYLNGELVYESVESCNKNDVSLDYDTIQKKILNHRLRPMVRTISTVSNIGTKDCDILIEKNITCLRECSNYELSSDPRPITTWFRQDFTPSELDRVTFPWSVVTITYKSQQNKWLRNALSDACALKTNEFSNSIHGCISLYPWANPQPYWITSLPAISAIEESNSSEGPMSPINLGAREVSIPVRVEPKVFFANERTFLSWVQFSIFLGGIGTAILGIGNQKASFSGIALIIISTLFSLYSLFLFYWRANRIRERSPGPYEERYGPAILVGVFLVAIIMCCIFKVPIKKSGYNSGFYRKATISEAEKRHYYDTYKKPVGYYRYEDADN